MEIKLDYSDGCIKLTGIDIPDSVTKMGYRILNSCEKLTKIICSEAVAERLEDYLRERTLGCFWDRVTTDTATEDEKTDWFDVIAKNARDCLGVMRNDVGFYRFVTEKGWVKPDDIDELISFNGSVECRAMLLEYKMKTYEDTVTLMWSNE